MVMDYWKTKEEEKKEQEPPTVTGPVPSFKIIDLNYIGELEI